MPDPTTNADESVRAAAMLPAEHADPEYQNRAVCCLSKSQVRRNIALLGLISSMVGLTPMLYGWISDTWSLRASFWTAMIIMIFTAALVFFKLPAHPQPLPEDLGAADLSGER